MRLKYVVDIHALKIAMINAGFDTNIALAKAARVSDRTVSSVLKGENPTYIVMCKLADALSLSADQAGKIFFSENLRIT